MAVRRWRQAIHAFIPFFPLAAAQYSQGQFFTPGLAIISSPQPGSQVHTGSTLSIAISVGGNQGQLKDFTPGSTSSDGTGYDNMEIFLISSQSNTNLTVTTDILSTEPGSNVKHADFSLPTCLQSGSYNLTVYETSRFQNNPLFVITQVPITIRNDQGGGGSCSSNNGVQDQPQDDSPLTGSPWIGGSVSKQASGSKATLASTNSQLLASTPSSNGQDGESGSQSTDNNNGGDSNNSQSPQTTAAGSANTAPAFTQVSSSAGASETAPTVTASGNSPQNSAPGSVSILFKTVTVTTNTYLPTAGNDKGSGGILFPISAASVLLPSSFSMISFLVSLSYYLVLL